MKLMLLAEKYAYAWLLLTWTLTSNVYGLDNSLALTPPMGWMSWGYYGCAYDCTKDKCLNEKLIVTVANELYNGGYMEAGYQYIVIDDCWSEKTRDHRGRLVPDRRRFPRGIKFLADYVHHKGLKLGLYLSAGTVTCMGFPGTEGHISIDARTFAEWGVDYVKFDGCYTGVESLNTAYVDLGRALNRTGRPMVYSCSWPYYIEYIHKQLPYYTKVARTCNLWRNYHDVFLNWGNVKSIIAHYEEKHERLSLYHGPGHWNDPDMLILGTQSLTQSQSRIQMALWSLMSAPLFMSCDFRKVREWEKALLQNPYLISINQDPLGAMPRVFSIDENFSIWVKRQAAQGSRSVYSIGFVNLGRQTAAYSMSPEAMQLDNLDGYLVTDVFKEGVNIINLTFTETMEIVVPPMDIVVLTLFPL